MAYRLICNARGNFAPLNKSDGDFLPRLSVFLSNIPIYVIAPVFLFTALNIASAAEDTSRGSTAATMPHPELSPLGIHGNSFIFYPSFLYSLDYDDNVFATDGDKESSYISEFKPAISAYSNWSNHALNFTASSSAGTNHTFSSEDYTDWSLDTDGRLDIRHDTKLLAGASVSHEHVSRTAPDNSRGIEPTEFDRSRIFTRYSQRFGRIISTINLNLVRTKYSDVAAIQLGNPVTIDNSTRDRTESRFRLRGGFLYVGDEQVFISIEGFDRDYDEVSLTTGRDKSSSGIEGAVGASFDYDGVLLGEISLGYRSQVYKQPLPDIDTPVTAATIRWNITDLTTLSIGVDQSIQESIEQFYSGYISTTTNINLAHELNRNLLLNLSFYFTRDKYESIAPFNRDDKTYNITAGSTYKINRNLNFNIQYVFLKRESNFDIDLTSSDQFDFSRNLISFQLQAQY